MYLETGSGSTNAGTATFAFGTATGTRAFKVKVTYLTCHSTNLAPAGCVQYFTAVSGSFQSYNYAGGALLNNQNYQTCIRQAQGFCSISYSQSATTSPDPFALLGRPGGVAAGTTPLIPANSINGITCTATFVAIPSTITQLGERLCGGVFNPETGQTVGGTVIGKQSEHMYTRRHCHVCYIHRDLLLLLIQRNVTISHF
jgi:hypothetical protein